jgi:hypothetical protein
MIFVEKSSTTKLSVPMGPRVQVRTCRRVRFGYLKAGYARNPDVRGQKFLRRFDHVSKHPANRRALGGHFGMPSTRDVATVMGEVKRRFRLALFTIGISQFADEVRLISALGPRFATAFCRRSSPQ